MDKNQQFSHIGEEIRDALDDAVKTLDFSQLNHVISSTMNGAVDEFRRQFSDSSNRTVKKMSEEYEKKRNKSLVKTPIEELNVIERREVGKVSSVLYTVFGGIGLAVSGIVATVFGTILLATGTTVGVVGTCIATPFVLLFMAMIGKGSFQRQRLQRFRRYLKICGNKTYCDIKLLASQIGKSKKYVVRDLKKMLQLNMLPQGHMDDKATCLMLNDETYQDYLEAKDNYLKHSEPIEVVKMEEGNEENEFQHLVQEGQQYINKIRAYNDEIEGEVISQKLFRLENVLTEIYGVLKDYPQKEKRLRKFMDYYLPTTMKLVQTYADFENVSIQGENIISSKKEIEETLDTINLAFEKLLDDLFQDVAMDASTDAQVLQTILAQEGLAGDTMLMHEGEEK